MRPGDGLSLLVHGSLMESEQSVMCLDQVVDDTNVN